MQILIVFSIWLRRSRVAFYYHQTVSQQLLKNNSNCRSQKEKSRHSNRLSQYNLKIYRLPQFMKSSSLKHSQLLYLLGKEILPLLKEIIKRKIGPYSYLCRNYLMKRPLNNQTKMIFKLKTLIKLKLRLSIIILNNNKITLNLIRLT